MAVKTLTFELLGKPKGALNAMGQVQRSAGGLGSTFAKLGGIIGVAFTAREIINFAKDSVNAFLDAEKAQATLADAFARFPALVDTNQKALQDLNSELQKKTGIDDDSMAVAQAQLAQFGLTGDQIKKLSPLLQDYARKTGRDVVDASTDLGKALLGQGRVLKDVGIDFEDAGTVAGNFDQLVSGLTDKVGGYGEVFGNTATGKFAILTARFSDMQETIGGALVPALSDLADFINDDLMPGIEGAAGWFKDDGLPAIRDFVGKLVEYKDILGPAAVAVGVLTAAQWLLNAAMWANPVGAVIGTIIGGIALWTAGFMVMQDTIKLINSNMWLFGNVVANAAQIGLMALNNLLAPLNAIIGAINFITGSNFSALSFGTPNFKFGTPDAVLPGGRTGGKSSGVAPLIGTKSTAFASGGIVRATPGGVNATIGEAGRDEAVIPLSKSSLAAYGLGGGTNVIVNVSGAVGNEDFLAKTVVRAIQNAGRRGVTGVSFA